MIYTIFIHLLCPHKMQWGIKMELLCHWLYFWRWIGVISF